MRVLIACEFSGIVRDAFRARGHDAWSCDLLPSEAPGHHYEGDVRAILDPSALKMPGWQRWDLAIMHPECTYLTSSGERWFKDDAKAKPGILVGAARRKAREESIDFVKLLWAAPIERIAIENPIGVLSSRWQKPTHSAVAIRARRDQGDVLVAEKPAATGTERDRERARGAGASGTTGRGSVEGAQPHATRHRRCDGGTVGTAGMSDEARLAWDALYEWDCLDCEESEGT